MTKALKRAASVFLAILLIFTAFVAPITQPVKAVAVSAVVISAVLAAMAVWGVSTITAGMTAAQIQDWVSTKLNEWASSQSSTVASLIPISGISVTATALLVLGNAAANGVKSFVSWLHQNLNLTAGSTTGVLSSPALYGGVEMDYFPSGLTQNYYYISSQDLYMRESFYSVGGEGLYVFCYQTDNNFDVNYYVYSKGQIVATRTIYKAINHQFVRDTNVNISHSNTLGYYTFESFPSSVTFNGVTYNNTYSFTVRDRNLMNNVNIESTTTTGSSLKLKTDVSYNLPVDLTQPESLYLNTGAAIGATLEGVTDHVITGVVENNLDVSGTIAEEAPPYEVTGPVQVPGIQNIFPFCIPFDLYAFISCLYAEPEAPHFTWRFYIPNICDEEIEIDLAPFNTVAAIMRTMFLLLFCVGLAYETRKLLRS